MVYGYARVSTTKQANDGTSLDSQREQLQAAGVDPSNIYEDTYTGTRMDRPGFDDLMKVVAPGDTIIVTRLDRFGRTADAAAQTIKDLQARDIALTVLGLGTIDNTPIGRLIYKILLQFAEYERDMIVERTQSARQRLRETDPTYKEGRKKKYTRAQMDHAMDLLQTHSYSQVVAMTEIPRATLAREKKRRGLTA